MQTNCSDILCVTGFTCPSWVDEERLLSKQVSLTNANLRFGLNAILLYKPAFYLLSPPIGRLFNTVFSYRRAPSFTAVKLTSTLNTL